MDHLSVFHREVLAFEAAVRRAADAGGSPLVPSCPGWSVADLVVHLGSVHRAVAHIVTRRLDGPPDPSDLSYLGLPADTHDWPLPENAPHQGPVPASLSDWFAAGAGALESVLGDRAPDAWAWTWSAERTVGFWRRVQAVEASVHRWDAERALGSARPLEADFAADAVGHNFELFVPARRTWKSVPAGAGERFGFRRTDGPGEWTVSFDGDDVRTAGGAGPRDVEVAGTASDLLLFLWQRIPAERLDVTGDRRALDRYFALVPPV
ncbi:maleylpyruvate isomerase family mycothiol-dependent enzyme [Streptomyces sp. HU2014]|uniref:maleylpyruvate isomerase family mycothiol-dependent enzyme n=1 Tax=Streptomyces sp. HU2014 TaxID=2939414 RepID=UPI00200E2A53|nr:maleylpyruvate isomerase family mycothiol-dependent enzyme [Streptomyces sp. HU2014]UQI46544.1 maleylpyruvate isomerase family mycothiol-dependent enzyme [Streptomyces sp. HU2014]